jgi:dihydroxyacetone kinase-like protein
MNFTSDDLRALFVRLAARMTAERDMLCALDGAVGDADHGIAMEQGMIAARDATAALSGATMQDVFNGAAKGFLNAVGASSGPLYATAFMRAAKAAGPRVAMPLGELGALIIAMSDGIAERGKAERGQKTMLDAWGPAADAARRGASPPAIATAARDGAEATRAMQATLGRAARLGERSVGHPDPGAVSAAIVIETICALATREAAAST